ncbi:MAG TPA: hypothetical protein VFL91_25220 [Thermomicrobiales bacterium]|nr:hypothetical protein [Thermomicrobiales bacterium]
MQLLTAPLALLVDTLSFVVSALSLVAIRAPEPAPPARDERRSLRDEIGEGLRLILSTPLLWANAACRATLVSSGSIVFAVYLLYLNRALGLAPAAIGAVLAAGGPSSLLAGALAGRLARSTRLGRVLVVAAALAGAGNLLLPLASGPPRVAVPLLIAAGWVSGCCGTLYDLLQVSLRQAITPTRLLGRMTTTARFIILGTTPLGALGGGLLGDALGLRATLLVGAAGSSLAFLWLLCSPVRKLDTMPAPLVEEAAALDG